MNTDKFIDKQKESMQKDIKDETKKIEITIIEDPEFWTSKIENKDLLLMTEKEIDEFNQMNFSREDFLLDLEIHQPNIEKEDLINLIISSSKIPHETRYDSKGNIRDKNYFDKMSSNLNLENIGSVNPIDYGVTVNRTMIRTFPTFEPSYKKKHDIQFDRFMETAIYPWEPLVIYMESKDREWYFGRMYNYMGWIPKIDVALGNKEDIFNYTNKEPFLIVIDKQVFIDNILFDMGVRIPIIKENENSYTILIPLKDKYGNLKVREKEIDISEAFSKGYLPYTKENIIKQGFKFKGEEYGWGGINNKRDCSAFIMDIHRTFGLKLPRNTSQQGLESIGKTYDIKKTKTIPPATVLYMPGHTMLYLGEYGGEGYILHQFEGYYEKEGDKLNYIKRMRTEVTPVTIKTSTGENYIDKVYLGKEFIKK